MVSGSLVNTQCPLLKGSYKSTRQHRRSSSSRLSVNAAAPSGLDTSVRALQTGRDASSMAVNNGPSVAAVPGTEILPPPPPEVTMAPTQGLDMMMEQFKARNAAVQVPVPSSTPTPSSFPSLPSLPKLPSVDFKAAAESFAPPDLSDGAAAAASQASAAAAEAASQASAAAAGAAGAVGATFKDAASAASSLTSELSGQVGGLANSAGTSLQQVQAEVNTAAASLQGSANEALQGVQSSALEATSALTGAIQDQVTGVYNQLPPAAQDVLVAVSSAASDAAQFVAADPNLAAGATAVGVGAPIVLAWNSAYGGYAGPFSPEKALEVLQSQDAVLVDVRTERQRIDSGVPELKRGARGKGVALPPVQLLPSVSRAVRNPADLSRDILGAELASLARISRGTRVIVMDDRGDTAKAVARAATAAGVRRVHILEGGFRAWKAAELPLAERSSMYDDNPLAIVGDAAETVAEEAATYLKKPTNIALVLGGSAAVLAAVFNYHLLFEYIGVLGLEATIAWRILTYDSPQDALDDVNGALAKLQNATKLPAALIARVSGAVQQQQQEQSSQEGQMSQQQQRQPMSQENP